MNTGERISNRNADRRRNWGRERVADLSIGRSLLAEELPVIGEALNTRCHAQRQAREPVDREIRCGRSVCKATTVYVKLPPRLARSRGTKVGATVQLRPTNERWRNTVFTCKCWRCCCRI